MFRRKLLPGVAVLSLCLVGARPVHAQANLLTNGSFELPSLTIADTCDGGTPWCLKGSGNAPGWTVTTGVSVIHNNYLGGVNPPILVRASDGVQYLNMSQVGRVNGGISQFVAAVTGQRYRLTFDASAWATNAVGATIAYDLTDPLSGLALASGTFTAGVGGIWTSLILEANAISNSIGVSIRSTFAPEAAMGVDNVRLVAVGVSAVPEPSTYVLLATGLVGLGVVARRRRTLV